MDKMWDREAVLALCYLIEGVCPEHGYHVALTGGLLYKDGLRKDADILFYSIRQKEPDREGLTKSLMQLGCMPEGVFGWMQKATYAGKRVDFFFPETSKSSEDGKSSE